VVSSRRDFDGALLDAAIEAGATLVPWRVTGVHRNGSGWVAASRAHEIQGDWLLGADGANSLVRRTVFRPFRRAELLIATGYFVRHMTARQITVLFQDAPPGYLWSFPRPDHLAVGIGAHADETSSGALQATVRSWIAEHLGTQAVLERYSWPIPAFSESSFAEERPAGDRWMLLGDAAGLVDPITGEGIYFALQSAGVAAESLMSGGDAARTYEERVREEIHDELVRAARLKARFYRPQFLTLMLVALNRSARIRAILADIVAGRQTYRGLRRTLLQTLELKLMFGLFGRRALELPKLRPRLPRV
jgi:flavin-dependent dehydrogenase